MRDVVFILKINLVYSTKEGKKLNQLVKDLGVMSRLEAKSSLNILCVIKAKNVLSDSSNFLFVMVSGQLLGWKPQPGMEEREMY